MHVSEFDYDLPSANIAQSPCEPRDAARLLVDRGRGPSEHRRVSDLPDLLTPGDLLVLNDTRVLPARLHLNRRSGGRVEVLVLEPLGDRRWTALVRPGGRLTPGEVLIDAMGTDIIVFRGRADDPNSFVVEFLGDGPIDDVLSRLGEMPLPPYITTRLEDSDRYQTVYSRRAASAAAPTAGLHFTPALFARLAERGVGIAHVELVVGLDTFRPITTEDPLQHTMHTESFHVDEATMDRILAADRVVAVGTTSVRTIESALATGRLSGRTDLFVHRGFPWKRVDMMMTNFHLPRTTLLMMIDAFVGPRWRRLYAEALVEGYRFLSFGDATLLDRHAL